MWPSDITMCNYVYLNLQGLIYLLYVDMIYYNHLGTWKKVMPKISSDFGICAHYMHNYYIILVLR